MSVCSPAEVIGSRIDELCIDKVKLCNKVGMSYELLRRSLKGTRGFTGIELINLCEALDLTLEDFID